MSAQDIAAACDLFAGTHRRGVGDPHAPARYWQYGLARACSRLAELGAWNRVLEYCYDLDRMYPPEHPDAAYFRGLHQLMNGGPGNDDLLSVVRMRRNSSAVPASGLDTEGRHLDALIAAQLFRLKGREAANTYLAMCRPWHDAFFDASRLRQP